MGIGVAWEWNRIRVYAGVLGDFHLRIRLCAKARVWLHRDGLRHGEYRCPRLDRVWSDPHC